MSKPVEVVSDILWPTQEWNGERRVCDAVAQAAIAALASAGFAIVPKAKLEGLEHAVGFARRWTWYKEGNGTTDAERLSAIKHHPVISAAQATP